MPSIDTARKSTKDIETKVSPPFGQRWSHDHSCDQVLANVCSCYCAHTFQGSNGWGGVEWRKLFHSPSVLVPSHSVTQGLPTPLCSPADHTCSLGSPLDQPSISREPHISAPESQIHSELLQFLQAFVNILNSWLRHRIATNLFR